MPDLSQQGTEVYRVEHRKERGESPLIVRMGSDRSICLNPTRNVANSNPPWGFNSTNNVLQNPDQFR